MQHNDVLVHEETIKRAPDTRATAQSQFKQTIAKCTRVWQTKVRAIFGRQLNQTRVIGDNIDRPRFDFGKHPFVEVLDLECHARMLANTLTWRNETRTAATTWVSRNVHDDGSSDTARARS